DDSQKFPFICSNSAPLTSQVNTDFPSLPKTNVTSNEICSTFRFMGVPYASPPTSSLRFRYPEPWKGTYVNATGFQSACLQFGSFANNDAGLNPWGISENCLFLNIYTSYLPSSPSKAAPLRPVFFWIHGGGNLNGMGSDETFDRGPLVSRGDVVLVTINYRLNIFGFLGLNTSDSAIPGNFAMADKIAALHWVQEHIADFGVVPKNQRTLLLLTLRKWKKVQTILPLLINTKVPLECPFLVRLMSLHRRELRRTHRPDRFCKGSDTESRYGR
ncbi:Carboxylesterase family-domain-containing protein, partial [Lentinula boryana]